MQAAAGVLARDDLPAWRRAEILDRTAAALGDRSEEFARRIVAEAGKPIRDARGEVARCLDTLRFSAVEARRLVGEMVPLDASRSAAGRLGFSLRVPVGVVAATTAPSGSSAGCSPATSTRCWPACAGCGSAA